MRSAPTIMRKTKNRQKTAKTLATTRKFGIALTLTLSVMLPAASRAATPAPQAQPATPQAAARSVGAIKSITGHTITLITDSGAETNIVADDSTRILRTNPGEKDLKAAVAIKLSDLQTGDRMLVRGRLAGDGKTLVPSTIVVLKKSDVSDLQQQQLQDWQRRGVGGLVRAVDAPAGTVTIAVAAPTGNKSVVVHTAKNTIVRRYAPDSVKFDDAKPGSLSEIKPGDQLRARGTSVAGGADLAADEIVSGAFRNIAGIITSVDSASHTVTVMDLATKKPVVVRIGDDSQIRKLPPVIAQRIAMRLKGGAAPGAAAQAGSGAPSGAPAATLSPGVASPSAGAPGDFQHMRGAGPGGRTAGGAADLQQILSRMPPLARSDLVKGDAVMLVATGGPLSTAITLLTGVEAILTASPDGSSAASILSPWNLGSSPAEAAISQ